MVDDELTTATDATTPTDVRSDILAAFEAQDTPQPEAPQRQDAPASDAGRSRGPDGKFVKAEEPAAVAPVAEPAETQPEAKPEPVDEVSKATARWSPANREMLAKLPEDAQAFIIARHREMEADHTRKTTEIAAFKRDYEPIQQMLDPYRSQMQQGGFTPATLIQSWMGVEKGLMAGGDTAVNLVASIVNNYRIDRASLARALGIQGQQQTHQPADPPAPQPENGQQPVLPPQVAAKFDQYDRFIQNQEQISRQREQQAYQQAASRVEGEIQQFSSATDSAGALLHPYFSEVEGDMQLLVLAARASGQPVPPLSDLYDRAIWANPSIRARIQADSAASSEAQRAAAERQRTEEARAKASRARQASKSVTGAPSAASPAAKSNGSLRDELRAAAENLEIA